MILFRFLLAIFLLTGTVYGQVTVTSSIVTSPPVTACTTTFLTVSGFHNYGGYTYTGATVLIVGSTINVSLNYTFGIGIAVITPFTQSVDIGMIPTGSYTTLVNGTVNGTPYSPFTMSLVSTSCCGAVSSFTSSATSVCVGGLVQFTNTSTGSIGQAWIKDGVAVGTALNYSFVASIPGPNVFTLAVTNGVCFDSLSQTIDVLSIPVVDSLAVNTATTCVGKLIVLTSYSTGSLGTSGKKWFENGVQIGTGSLITAIASGVGIHTYSFVATNNICSDTMNIQVEFIAPPTINNFDVGPLSICFGDTVFCTSSSTNTTSLTWKLNNVVSGSGSSFIHIPTVSGNYQYRLVAANAGCSDSTSAIVVVMAPASAPNLGADTSYCTGTIVLDAGSAVSYLWNDGSVGQFLNVTAPGTYWVKTINSNGCSAKDSIIISSCLGLEKYQNNVFKVGPNPTQNELFIQTKENISEMNISIKSVAGKIVFQKSYRNEKYVNINTEHFETGIYFVSIQTLKGAEVIKIVKQD